MRLVKHDFGGSLRGIEEDFDDAFITNDEDGVDPNVPREGANTPPRFARVWLPQCSLDSFLGSFLEFATPPVLASKSNLVVLSGSRGGGVGAVHTRSTSGRNSTAQN